MNKVALTGATGLIGREAIEPLKNNGFSVFCLSSKICNIFNYEDVRNFIKSIQPEYLLHFAWVSGKDYLSNPNNELFVDASMNLLRVFKEYGGKRAVFSGTCFEYDYKNSPIKEDDPLNPLTLYAKSKVSLKEKATQYCSENNIEFVWGRIFYVYGRNERPERLTAYIINSLKENKTAVIKYGQLEKDYMYTKDIAEAFVKILKSNYIGIVNICSGKSISLKDFASTIAKKMKKEGLLKIFNEKTTQPNKIIGDNDILFRTIGFKPHYNLDKALDEIINEN